MSGQLSLDAEMFEVVYESDQWITNGYFGVLKRSVDSQSLQFLQSLCPQKRKDAWIEHALDIGLIGITGPFRRSTVVSTKGLSGLNWRLWLDSARGLAVEIQERYSVLCPNKLWLYNQITLADAPDKKHVTRFVARGRYHYEDVSEDELLNDDFDSLWRRRKRHDDKGTLLSEPIGRR